MGDKSIFDKLEKIRKKKNSDINAVGLHERLLETIESDFRQIDYFLVKAEQNSQSLNRTIMDNYLASACRLYSIYEMPEYPFSLLSKDIEDKHIDFLHFMLCQGMRAIQCGYSDGPQFISPQKMKDKKNEALSADPLCMKARYAPAKHLP